MENKTKELIVNLAPALPAELEKWVLLLHAVPHNRVGMQLLRRTPDAIAERLYNAREKLVRHCTKEVEGLDAA